MGFFKRYRLTIIIAIFLLATLAVFSINAAGPGSDSLLGRAALEVAGPVQRALTRIGVSVDDIINSYFNLVNAAEENKQLTKEVARLRVEQAQTEDLRLANIRLRQLLALIGRETHETVAAEVVAADISGRFRTVIINKGSIDGIGLHMPVTHIQGLAGRVVLVSPHYSKVLLLVDPNAGVDVLVQRNRTRGMIVGAGDAGLVLNYVQSKFDVRVGDVLITSGVAGVFPKGLLVGAVATVKTQGRGGFSRITAQPAVDFHRLEEVMVIIRQPGFVQRAIAEAEKEAKPKAKTIKPKERKL